MSPHERSAAVRSVVADALARQDDPETVTALVDQVVTLVSDVSGHDGEGLVDLLLQLAQISKLPQRRTLEQHALRIAQGSYGERDVRVLTPLRLLAGTMAEAGDGHGAFVYLEQLLSIEDEHRADPIFTLRQLVYLSWDLDRPALSYAERKLALVEARGVPGAELLGELIDLGLCQKDAGMRLEALTTLRRAYELAIARPDEPSLRSERASAAQEIAEWIQELERENSDIESGPG